MIGMSRTTGAAMARIDHIAQSVQDILTTPVGSRVMRRDYGSDLPRLIDAPINGETVVDLYVATAEALARWEPRITLRRVQIADAAAGTLHLQIDAETTEGARVIPVTIGGAA